MLDRGASSGQSPTAALWVCAGVFAVAAVFGFVDIHVFQYLPETPKPPHRGLELLTALEEPLKNKRFLSFAGFVATLTFAVTVESSGALRSPPMTVPSTSKSRMMRVPLVA